MTVELVAVERRLWSGKAVFVFARTTEGEIGIMPGHELTLAQLETAGLVRIDTPDGESVTVAVHGGFLSITPEGVTILAENAELGEEIDVERARAAASNADESSDGAEAKARAEVRLKAAGAAGRRRPPERRGDAMSADTVITIALLLGLVVLGWLVSRRLRLIRSGGVDVSLRRVKSSRPTSTRGWNLGLMRYQGDEVAWYRVISLSRGAEVRLNRRELEIVDRRVPGPSEEHVVPADATVLRCRDRRRLVELAMTPEVLTGFLSWLESTPPGTFGVRQAS